MAVLVRFFLLASSRTSAATRSDCRQRFPFCFPRCLVSSTIQLGSRSKDSRRAHGASHPCRWWWRGGFHCRVVLAALGVGSRTAGAYDAAQQVSCPPCESEPPLVPVCNTTAFGAVTEWELRGWGCLLVLIGLLAGLCLGCCCRSAPQPPPLRRHIVRFDGSRSSASNRALRPAQTGY